jgi:hypothetical protein
LPTSINTLHEWSGTGLPSTERTAYGRCAAPDDRSSPARRRSRTATASVEYTGDGAANEAATRDWMKFLYDNNISHANWSLNDKLEGASALTPGASANGGWSDSNLTQSGRLVKDIIKNW